MPCPAHMNLVDSDASNITTVKTVPVAIGMRMPPPKAAAQRSPAGSPEAATGPHLRGAYLVA